MVHDVDRMRDLLFVLEERQVSPRATIIIYIAEEASALECAAEDVADCLNALLDLAYIDGPGDDETGIFLFRKLTRKGAEFVRMTRHPRDWEKMKVKFASQRVAHGA